MLAELIPKLASMGAPERQAYRPRPSGIRDADTRCLRQNVYAALGVEPEALADRAYLVFDDSSWHEELTADWIRKSAYHLHSEQMHVNVDIRMPSLEERACACGEIVPAGHMAGHIDGIITDLTGEDYLWEHKAINHFGFERYHAGRVPDGYVGQVCAYIQGLQKVQPQIDSGILLIKNKNTAGYLEFQVYYDSAADIASIEDVIYSTGEHITPQTPEIGHILGNAIAFFEEVEKLAMAMTLPERPYSFGTDFPCGYCAWEEICWRDYAHELAQSAKDVALDGSVNALCRSYVNSREIRNEHEELCERFRWAISKKMRDMKVASGRAGEFSVNRRLQNYSRIEKDKLTPEQVRAATVTTTSEILTVRESKPKAQVGEAKHAKRRKRTA